MLSHAYKHNYVLIVILWGISTQLYAQSTPDALVTDSTNEELSYTPLHTLLMYADFYVNPSVDYAISSSRRIGVMGGMSIGYTFKDSIQRHALLMSGNMGNLIPPYESESSTTEQEYLVNASYSASFAVARYLNTTHDIVLEYYLGGKFESRVDLWIPSYLGYGWSFSNLGGIDNHFLIQYGSHTWNISLFLPVLGSLQRPPLSGYSFKDEAALETGGLLAVLAYDHQFVSWHNFFEVALSLGYSYRIQQWLHIDLRYDFIYTEQTFPQTKRVFYNHFQLGPSFHF